ncbi:GNAT family N-acetyltransferase [Bacillus salitolerans]|uniref:GNAT family N-acetyltransferase n=1 Tax=Bacillus salitolerans TaxID=1437434 RepID=A0ABW4LV07_9BACI
MIVKATDKDIEFILTKATDAASEGVQQEISSEKAEALFTNILKNDGYYLVYKNSEDEVGGWILLGENKDYFTDIKHGFIYDIYVLPSFRGKSISKNLIIEGINSLKSKGFNEIRLNVYSSNHAKEIYKKLGFEDLHSIMTISV